MQLQQVVLNLIVNAVEAMKDMTKGPRDVSITTGKTEVGDTVVSVRDSGPGLAPSVRDTLTLLALIILIVLLRRQRLSSTQQ